MRVAIGLLVFLIVGVWLWCNRSNDVRDGPEGNAARPPTPAELTNNGAPEQVTGTDRSGLRKAPDVPVAATQQEPGYARSLSVLENPVEPAQLQDRAIEVRQQMFRAEVRDSAWAASAEASILELIAASNPGLGFTLIETECRKTTCRVRLSPAGMTQAEWFANFSLAATMHAFRLRETLEAELGLQTILSDSNVTYGAAESLLFLSRNPDPH